MNRKEVWFKWALEFARGGSSFDNSINGADEFLEEYDKRFVDADVKQPTYSLENLPPFEDLLEGVMIEGAYAVIQYQEGVDQFMIKFTKNGLPGMIYMNEKTEALARYAYQQNAKEYMENGLQQVDSQRTHEDD